MSLRRKIAISALATVVILLGVAALGIYFFANESYASGIDAYTGTARAVSDKDMLPAMLDGEHYSDKYTIEGYFKGGGDIYVSLLIKNFGMGDGKLTFKSRLTLADGTSLRGGGNEKARDKWSFATSPFSLEADGQKITGKPREFVVSGAGEGYTFEITFKASVPPWRPGSGRITFGSNDIVWDTTLLQPKSAISGWIEVNGERKEIGGYGYAVHTYANVPPHEHAKRWVDFRAISGSTVVYYKEFTAPEKLGGATYPYLLVAQKGKVVFESLTAKVTYGDWQTDNKHENKYRVPEKLLITDEKDGKKLKLAIAAGKLKGREDVIEGLSAIEGAIVSKLAKPVNYRYGGKFEVSIETPEGEVTGSGSGTLEVNHLNK